MTSEKGQGLLEYTALTALILLAATAMLFAFLGHMHGMAGCGAGHSCVWESEVLR